MAAALAGGGDPAASALAADEPTTHVLDGELARILMRRNAVVVKAGRAREVEVRLAASTLVSSRGRLLRLADLRPGERIMVLCADDAGGVHRAQRIKIGGRPPSAAPR